MSERIGSEAIWLCSCSNAYGPVCCQNRRCGRDGCRGTGIRMQIERRSEAIIALVRAGGGFWFQPFGEPEWVQVPARVFLDGRGIEPTSGNAPRLCHRPNTGQHYRIPTIYPGHGNHPVPQHWQDDRPPQVMKAIPSSMCHGVTPSPTACRAM